MQEPTVNGSIRQGAVKAILKGSYTGPERLKRLKLKVRKLSRVGGSTRKECGRLPFRIPFLPDITLIRIRSMATGSTIMEGSIIQARFSLTGSHFMRRKVWKRSTIL